MRWTPGGRSRNLEDRRGLGGGGMRRGTGVGLGGLLILGLLSLIFGRDLISPFLGTTGGSAPAAREAPVHDPREERQVEFVSFVLDDAQQTWARLFPALGRSYQAATLVLFRDAVQSACGFAESATGPFYCPGDHKVYIDLGFYDELRERFGAPGDFAQAYVLAHEIGHHVQRLLGIEEQVRRAQRGNRAAANDLSVRMELQADCFAGIWGHSTARRDLLEAGDVEEALTAAAAIGDDRIQRQTTGRVAPETFTHGSSRQRMRWFRRGMETGQPSACNTFEATDL
ncbi:MAG: zinc metallopeptidase [Bryobacteraceae bacterium]|nr:zinc metallopeptidase [Bryobacteraceae bacterium]